MKTTKFLFLFIILALASCKDQEKKQPEVEDGKPDEVESISVKPLEETRVINLPLNDNDTSLTINNIQFTYEGAEFDNTKGSYIQTSSKDLNINDGIGINTVFNFSERDGAKAQTLFSMVDANSATGTAAFTFYISNRRITGVAQGKFLWGNDYTYNKGMSDVFFDSPQLEIDKYYSLSINITSEKIELFVNNELYQEFNNLSIQKLKGDHIVLGAFKKPQDPAGSKILKGKIRNLEIYNRSLTLDEIDDYYLINQGEMNEQNDALALEQMEKSNEN
ncbi:sialidase domain-containing protein [Psychroserpens sp.]|uniref:sialidase domain-containing protein n=1 Tax=Psychroserpens sp. TaxID=2020870 RepID=UPI001B2DB574|nr:sialidase domain-containing protein [Psychroserpens sp.]MBO6605394.1 hypothetical protein [Psychroserpens sp.]MBO6630170.1 hypothetical protein [Psychroserpens sp.]MBO6653797.1 hypothetical protein [Psychroserpens sp.]MBO6682118.1 hypothetical protein [Psychroserpens sp.]MBO6748768.1 hypothetical protein [Psychroserpens sp.]